jgi:hypothetical protein
MKPKRNNLQGANMTNGDRHLMVETLAEMRELKGEMADTRYWWGLGLKTGTLNPLFGPRRAAFVHLHGCRRAFIARPPCAPVGLSVKTWNAGF